MITHRDKDLRISVTRPIMAGLLLTSILGVALWSTASKFSAQWAERKLFSGSREQITVLVLGLDPPIPGGSRRSDAMMLVRLSRSGSLLVVSLMRDLWVWLPREKQHGKLNSAYAFGGAEYAREVVEQLIGSKTDYVIVIKPEHLASVIDSLGGLEINLPRRIKVKGREGFHCDRGPGKVHLSGREAVAVMMDRSVGDDWGRVRLQQRVLSALLKGWVQPGTLPRIRKQYRSMLSGLESNLDSQVLLAAMIFIADRKIQPTTLTLDGTPAYRGRQSVLVVDQSKLRDLRTRFVTSHPSAGRKKNKKGPKDVFGCRKKEPRRALII